MTTKIIRLVISQTKEELVATGAPLEFFATVIYEQTLGDNGVPRGDLENVVTAWAHTVETEEEITLERLKMQIRSVLKHKNVLRVRWMRSGTMWEL